MIGQLVGGLMVLVATFACFVLGARCGERFHMRALRGSLAYLLPGLLSIAALSVAAAARGDEMYTGEVGIWKTESGVYTNMPLRYSGESKRIEVGYERWTPVVDSTPPIGWATSVAVRVVPSSKERSLCAGVFLGNSAMAGGTTVCVGETAVVRQERVRRRGEIVTTTDTVLMVDRREVMRIEGRSHEHDPRKTKRLK